MRNELLTEAKLNNYRPSSEAERVAAEEFRNRQRLDAYYARTDFRRDAYLLPQLRQRPQRERLQVLPQPEVRHAGR